MIVHEFNWGWGDEWPLKHFERSIVRKYLSTMNKRVVIVNTVWYGADEHQQCINRLRTMQFDCIALVAMIDPPTPQATWFDEFNCEVICLGYYPGAHEIDYWALMIDEYFKIDFDVATCHRIDTAFMCLNRKPRWWRQQVCQQLSDQGLLDQGVVTLGHDSGCARTLHNDVQVTELAPNTQGYGIINDIASLGPPNLWQRCFINVVTETVFDVDCAWFVSEKIYKPVVGMRPFLVYAPNGAQAWLEHIGLESFVNDFTDISELDLSEPNNIAPMLSVLAAQPLSYLHQKYLALWPKIMYNKHRFYEHVQSSKIKIQQGIQCQI